MSHRDLPVRGRVVIPGSEIIETASRSSGPGGQHVNKTNTRITLRWNLTNSDALTPPQRARLRTQLANRLTLTGSLVVHAGRHRSQARNRELARDRLAELVRNALTPQRHRVATKPSRASKKRIQNTKRQRSQIKKTRSRPKSWD